MKFCHGKHLVRSEKTLKGAKRHRHAFCFLLSLNLYEPKARESKIS